MSSCTSQERDRIEDFHKRAIEFQDEIPILLNVSYTARGLKDNVPHIRRLDIALDQDETIVLPAIAKDMTDDEVQQSPFYDNISVYANSLGLSDSIGFEETKGKLKAITDLANRLEVYKIQSTPRLGEFIIFSLSDKEEVIFVHDLESVRHDYWKKFFEANDRLSEKWFFRLKD